jgi:uncharacterized protein YxeA
MGGAGFYPLCRLLSFYRTNRMILKASEEAMTDALIKELCSGRQFMESLQNKREIEAAKIAQDYRKIGRRKDAKFVHLMEIPQHEYLKMDQKYPGCWDDREFVKDAQRLEPTMASNKISMSREI